MSADARFDALLRGARRRRAAIVAGFGIACVPVAGVISWRVLGWPAALAPAAVAGAVVAAGAALAVRRIDRDGLARRLDAAWPDMEDSAALLGGAAQPRSALARLQRGRIERRLERGPVPDIREPWPHRALGLAYAIAAIACTIALLWPAAGSRLPATGPEGPVADRSATTRLERIRIGIVPPAYTGLPEREESVLDVQAPEGSRLRWRLRFTPAPASAALVLHDGTRIGLERDGATWTAEHVLDESALYRIVLEGAPPPADARLHRLDAVADTPPEIRVERPERTLTRIDPGDLLQAFRFEVRDDHGVGAVHLAVTLAQGSGESVRFAERDIALPAPEGGDARRQRYQHTLDLGELGIASGDEAIVRVVASDHREPEANSARSAAFILRWPEPPAEASVGMEGIVQDAMPAYFRSQRQIIIDSEALVAARPALDAQAFVSRSDALGVDQKILRLRYGEFLGEEFETRDRPASAMHDAHDESDHPAGPEAAGHDAGPAPAGFGDATGLLAEYGHTHDVAEAATLLDEPTKAILRRALDAMWQAEGHLRLGEPEAALPHEYRALEAIKQVQQSTRIYLARVGLELPAIDETRRLSGDREGVTDREAALPAATHDDAILAQAWQRLGTDTAPDWDALAAWLDQHAARVPDALGVIAAIDEARRDPACASCRRSLRRLLWPLLPRPAAAVELRAPPDAAGRAYLDALGNEAPP